MPTTAQLSGVADADLFNSGKLGMDVTGIWIFAAFKDAPFKWDIQVEPMIKQHAHTSSPTGLPFRRAARMSRRQRSGRSS